MQGDGGFQAKVLEIIEEDLDHRLGGANFALQNVGSVPLRRMYNAGLPPAGMHLCKELLGKIAALDHAREAAEEVGRLHHHRSGWALSSMSYCHPHLLLFAATAPPAAGESTAGASSQGSGALAPAG